ncbi:MULTISPECIES: hypothetical protein [Bifidobacterium]|uniref:hypothetical protein n=1 Tax=Bifidobacterium TaxID=1678 RepID=UPI001E4F5FD3|nr:MULTISPECIES: hypothetical protein [Bifidobacterium]
MTISSVLLPAGMPDFYDEATRTILIDMQLIYCQKRCTLVHELIHWQHATPPGPGSTAHNWNAGHDAKPP